MVQLISTEGLNNQVTIERLKSLEDLMSLEDIGGNKPGYDPSSYNYKFTILKQLEWLKWFLTNYPNGVGFFFYNGILSSDIISVNDPNIEKFGSPRNISQGDIMFNKNGFLYAVNAVNENNIYVSPIVDLKGASVISAKVTEVL